MKARVSQPSRNPLGAAVLGAVLLLTAVTPGAALAKDDLDVPTDLRMEGYKTSMVLDKGGTALTWLLYILLGFIGLSVMFKDAKRSHLD